MTVSDRYAPGTDPGPTYPTAFGITFTPPISGAVIGVAGTLAAGWLAMNLLSPAFTQMQEIQGRVADKQSKIDAQDKTLKKLQDVVDRVNKAKAQNTQVRSLFSNQQALDTLLLDLNRLIVSKSAVLRKFTPDSSGIVTDGSQGAELNNKLKRQVTSVEFEGTFNQTLEIMRAVDRLQTVLILKDFKMELQQPSGSKEDARPSNLVKSSFKLYAYVPLSEEEAAKVAPPAGQPAPSGSGAASPSPAPASNASPKPN
jgi:type IV pilus assembly protein PilO